MTFRRSSLWSALGAAILLVGVALVRPRLAAAGWLIAFLFAACIFLGSLALMLIGRLTGGDWRDFIAPFAQSMAKATPFLAPAMVPLLVALPLLYTHSGPRPEITAGWGNTALYAVRELVLLACLSALSRRRPSRMIAALGLVLYGAAWSIFAVDWIEALQPHFMLTAFGAQMAIEAMAAAMAAAVLLSPAAHGRLRDDLAGLLLALVMGGVYLGFMDFLVTWYGNVPHRAAWYVARAGIWLPLLWAALLLAGLLPFLLLLTGRTRFVAGRVKLPAALLLAGIFLHLCWLVAPAFGAGVLPCALAGLCVLAGAMPNRIDGPIGAESADG